MAGNSAAVQADIVVPGMAGTHTSVKIGRTTSNRHAPGVGYQAGEPYAKWGRFACEMPARSCSLGQDPYAREGVWGHPSFNSPRRCPRSWGGNEGNPVAGQENEYGNGGGRSTAEGACPTGNSRDGGAAHLDDRESAPERFRGRDATRAPTIPSVRGGPAYLEVTMPTRVLMYAANCFLTLESIGCHSSICESSLGFNIQMQVMWKSI